VVSAECPAEWLSHGTGSAGSTDLIAVGTSARDPARVLIQSWLSKALPGTR
jgi:hypothetical protein